MVETIRRQQQRRVAPCRPTAPAAPTSSSGPRPARLRHSIPYSTSIPRQIALAASVSASPWGWAGEVPRDRGGDGDELIVRCRCGHGRSFGQRDTALRRGMPGHPGPGELPVQCFGAARTRTGDGLIDPIEGRWVKNGRLEIVLDEPLTFHAARTRPRPRGRVSSRSSRVRHRTASPCRRP